ncbi:MAG: helix-turn-helix transcriptional regulator [Desulfosalsimonadaceae bacterium]
MKEIDIKIGDRIKNLRKNLGLSQIDLAEKISLSFQQIQKYEKGQTKITVDRLQQISEALNVSIRSFFTEDVMPQQVSSPIPEYGSDKSEGRYSQLLTKEEVYFLKIFRKIENRKIREGILKLVKGVEELEKKK